MSITFQPERGTTTVYTYYEAGGDAMPGEAQGGCIRFASDEPSCQAHNGGGWAIQQALGLEPDYVGRIPNSSLVALESLVTYEWPAGLERYRDRLLQVIRCAMYHKCDVTFG